MLTPVLQKFRVAGTACENVNENKNPNCGNMTCVPLPKPGPKFCGEAVESGGRYASAPKQVVVPVTIVVGGAVGAAVGLVGLDAVGATDATGVGAVVGALVAGGAMARSAATLAAQSVVSEAKRQPPHPTMHCGLASPTAEPKLLSSVSVVALRNTKPPLPPHSPRARVVPQSAVPMGESCLNMM